MTGRLKVTTKPISALAGETHPVLEFKHFHMVCLHESPHAPLKTASLAAFSGSRKLENSVDTAVRADFIAEFRTDRATTTRSINRVELWLNRRVKISVNFRSDP